MTPSQRFFLAFVAFFRVLLDRAFAEEVRQVRDRRRAATAGPARERTPTEAATSPEPAPAAAAPPAGLAPVPDAASLHVLSILQRDGRLIDFLAEDLDGFPDPDVGAAARTVHAGCRKALQEYVQLEPVFRDSEGATVTVPAGFDPAAIRLTGNVVGVPPFRGSLRHHGWRAARTAFPPLPPGHDPRILAPAEVEL